MPKFSKTEVCLIMKNVSKAGIDQDNEVGVADVS
jgi:hypothetical protein